MKGLFLSLILIVPFFSLAAEEQSVAQFQANSEFESVTVQSAELVFMDELTGDDLYKVTYSFKNNEAQDSTQVVCDYVWVEPVLANEKVFMTNTHIDCSEDIDTVLNPVVTDEP